MIQDELIANLDQHQRKKNTRTRITYVWTSRAARMSSSRSILADEEMALARVTLAYQRIRIDFIRVHEVGNV